MNYATAVPNYTLGTAPLDLLSSLSTRAEGEERGAIYTRAEVVNFILDLVGYRSEKPLWRYRILEPSFGGGDFLLPAIDRLLSSIKISAERPHRSAIRSAIRAVELHGETYSATHQAVYRRLCSAGFNDIEASAITNEWLSQGDFLLTHFNQRFTHIVGNPPYVRQESVPDALMALYRERYETIYDRADIYVPFIERSLELLSDDGKLSFICADRWMKNRYGSKLRDLISRNYSLTAYVDMVGSNAFLSEVSAYPAITLMERGVGKQTRVSGCPELSSTVLGKLANDLTAPALHANSLVTQTDAIAVGNDPWVFNSLAELALVRHLEAKYPLLEEAGCKVGIGVATGADKAFIGIMDDLDVETSRKLPLVMSKDIVTGDVQWRGMGVINPFGLDGKLVDLEQFPKLKAYLNARKSVIAKRHVAEKSPKNWYRTIDRIYPDLAQTPKLLIPDIKGDAHIVYDPGLYYPHHNLYFIVSNDWDLRALKLVLSSGIARLFVALYSTKMRGGYFRFQAQYLRRIRVPKWSDVPIQLQDRISQAVNTASTAEINSLVAELYQLSAAERSLIE